MKHRSGTHWILWRTPHLRPLQSMGTLLVRRTGDRFAALDALQQPLVAAGAY